MRRIAWLVLLAPLLALSATISVDIKSKTKDLPRFEWYKEAGDLLVQVVNSGEFQQEILAHKFEGKPGFASTGDSPQEVLTKLIAGAEVLNPVVDHVWSWDVVFYYSNNITVGYTYPNVTTLWVNTKFMDKYDLADMARNQAHEMTHKLGYGHDFKATKRRPRSVPYVVGSIVERLGRKILKGGAPAQNPAPRPAPKPRLAWWRRIF